LALREEAIMLAHCDAFNLGGRHNVDVVVLPLLETAA
jgi:hypothetical protein